MSADSQRNPPTQSEVQQIINYLNDLLDTMKR